MRKTRLTLPLSSPLISFTMKRLASVRHLKNNSWKVSPYRISEGFETFILRCSWEQLDAELAARNLIAV